MRAFFKRSRLGTAMMILAPGVALGFGSEVFFPVAVTSIVGALICLTSQALATHMTVGRVTDKLVRDLISANMDQRELVLSGLKEAERKWFRAEIARIEAELMSARTKPKRNFGQKPFKPATLARLLLPIGLQIRYAGHC
jgi:hypothetical protein